LLERLIDQSIMRRQDPLIAIPLFERFCWRFLILSVVFTVHPKDFT
jgi:hypothetical protein